MKNSRFGHLRKPHSLPQLVLYVLPIVVLFYVLTCYTAIVVLERIPHVQDEVVYIWQAQVFRSGHLYLRSYPEGLRRFFDHEFIINNGKWYGTFCPGQSVFLAIGLLVGAPWLINPLFGSFSVVLLFYLGYRVYSMRTALLVSLLFAVSPFYIVMSASYMGHTPSLFFTLLAFVGMTEILMSMPRAVRKSWYMLVGFSLGVVFLIRPYNVLPSLVILAIVMLRRFLSLPKTSLATLLREIAAFSLPFALLAFLNLSYNRIVTDHWLVFPYTVYAPSVSIGFGMRGSEWGAPFTPADAIRNLSKNYRALKSHLLLWPSFYAVLIGALAFLGKRRLMSLLYLFFLILQITAYFFYFHPGTYMGPRYWFEATWILVLLLAEGFVVLFSYVERMLKSRVISLLYVLMTAVLISLNLLSDLSYLPLFRGYNGMTRISLPNIQKPALVFVSAVSNWQAYGRFFIQQPALFEKQDVIFARDRALHNVPGRGDNPLPNQMLIDYFPGRAVYYIGE